MNMLRQILALALKEFLALVRDPRSRFVLIGPPIAQLIVFGYAASFDLDHVPVAIWNQDNGSESRELVSRIQGSPHFEVVAILDHDSQIAPLVDNKKVLAVLHIGPRFGTDLVQGHPASLQLILDGRNSNTAMLALNYLRTIVMDYNKSLAQRRGSTGPPVKLSMRAWYNEDLDSHWFIIPGIVGLLTLVVTLVVTALSVAREREQGTFDQLLVTPLRPTAILVGKSIPGLVIGVVEATFIILVAMFWFGIPLRGDVLALYAGLLLFLFSAVGVGLMISAISVTQQQAVLGAFLFLGGDPFRFRHAHRQHARGGTVPHLPGSAALLPRHRARRIPGRRQLRPALAAILADYRRLAVPAPDVLTQRGHSAFFSARTLSSRAGSSHSRPPMAR